MLEGIQQLLQLQQIDKEIVKLKQSLSEFPKRQEKIKESFLSKKNALDELEKNNEDFAKEKRKCESQIKIYEADKNKYKSQLDSVKTNKEYTAVNHELETISKKIEELETEWLLIMEREDAFNKEKTQRIKEFEKEKQKYENENARLKSLEEEKRTQLAVYEAEREKETKNVSPQFLELYERLVKRYPATVVAKVENNSCGGCHTSLVEQTIFDIKKEDKIIICEACARILYC